MTRLFLFCILFIYVLTGYSADYHRTINWFQQTQNTDLIDQSVPGFEGNIIIDQTGLPHWFESFELNTPEAEVFISNTVFEPILHPSAGLIEYQESELQYQSEIGVSAERSILRLTINPFVRRNNQIEKLVSFTVSIKENLNQLKSATASYKWKSASVLASGKWIRISTKSKGIYKVSFDQLKTWGFTNPDQVSMYGNGGYMLPVLNKDIQFDDLTAYPVWKGKDNVGKDCLFFYSAGNIPLTENLGTGTYTHQQNYYATKTFFYLSDTGTPLTINKVPELIEAAGKTVISFSNYTFYEKEALNLISSGSLWFGERFSVGSSQTITMALDNPDLTKSAQFVVSAAGRSSSASSLNVSLNGESVQNIVFQSTSTDNAESVYADKKKIEFSDNLPANSLQFRLTYHANNSSSNAWLDYIAVNYQSLLNMNADVYPFRGKGVDGSVTISEFIVKGVSSATKIVDVTDIHNTFEVPTIYADGQMKFKSNSEITREYIAFNPTGSIPEPELVGTVANQNLHAADPSEMIIVSNPALLSVANELAAFHRTTDQMTIQVVTPEVIYNEFSGGLPDPSAFRNYFRMCYERGIKSGEGTFKYVLLLGDGSFDNRNILGQNHNLIPTYQSDNSLSPTESFVTDDFFVFLDENEGGSMGTVDLGIGRIPAYSLDEAEAVLDKIINYRQQATMGNWRNVLTFIGDDEDNNTHMSQAEILATYVNITYPAFFTDKIYFDAYKQISSSGGEQYPDVTAAINKSVKQGTLVMNYTGHANERSLASEDVLDISIIDSWSNYNKLPVFVTATCEFSRFDSDETSAGERILFNSKGGGVGLFSTTRLVYSGANFVLNKEFFKYIFEKDQQGNNLRLGDVMLRSKAAANTGANQLNFTLLADPAMRLANPDYQVITSDIGGKPVDAEADTIRALSVVTVKGFVADSDGAKLTSFQGEIIPTVYDKAMQVKTLGNAGQTPMNYTVQSNIIYRGLASVINGEFEFSFFVPKDISVKLDKGKILYYASNELLDAHGYFDDFFIGGLSDATISDLNGPAIDLFMNSRSFKDGGTVSASSVLLAYLTDDSGINTVGTGIGHDITGILDDDYSNILVLNDYFQADIDSYTFGSVVFPLTGLAEGEHKLVVKVWDVLNNSSEKEIRFVVKDDFRIESVACYPNPMQEMTNFVFTHNQPDETFDVALEVFQTSGTRVDLFRTTVGSQGTESLPFDWIPSERQVKMSPGVYVYRITATTNDGKVNSGSGRLVFVYR
ncbi:MAG TPA: type IX secretion system sortase PorU [Prolixibacteraceae bacterium]|nr:type IX secretion system sortase PorU [Prolixibacteraceae bacterium]